MSRKRRKEKRAGLFRTLSAPPEDSWPQGAIHHGARIGMLLFLGGVITLFFPPEGHRTETGYTVGVVAEEDMVAEIEFEIPKTSEELERDRATAEAVIPPVFDYRPEARDSMAADLERFFNEVEEAARVGGIAAVDQVLTTEGIPALQSQAQLFLDPQAVQELRTAGAEVANDLMSRVLDVNDAQNILAEQIQVRYANGEELSIPTDSLLWGQAFLNQAFQRLNSPRPEMETVFRLLVIRYLDFSFDLDGVATDQARRQARQTVPLTKGSRVQGEVFVRAGERITDDQRELIEAYNAALSEQGIGGEVDRDWGTLIGSAILNLLILSIFGFLLFFFRSEVYGNFRWIFLQSLLVLVYFVAAWVIARQGFSPELLPIAFVALPVAVLWDGRMALILALLLAVLTGVQAPFGEFSILIPALVGGSVAALSARAVRRRSQTWIFIALISVGYALAILSQALIQQAEPGAAFVAVLWAAGNATASAILAMGFMPVFEWMTGITTDQTLLEWADPNRPLLKRLSLEAGGTYAHTINVANLAEAAATAIGANGLLTRVGIYYHDVGKVLKPLYFVENQPGGRNPHDKLKPHTSAAIVREHVIEGERMARDAGVPTVITDFIPEHHGTQLIGFFYEKAKEESEEELNQEEFRYPGPKPRTKETAISMLADSIESATRALQDPSPERIRELIRTIVEGKIRDGQLSDSPLNLREISAIQEQFAKVVGGMFHHRLDYPATKHITEALDENGPPGSAGDPGREGGARVPGSPAREEGVTAVPDLPAETPGGELPLPLDPETLDS